MTRSYSLAVVPGDGIGPEVTTQALTVLRAVAEQHDLSFDTVEYDLGARRYHATGETLPDAVLAEIAATNAKLDGLGLVLDSDPRRVTKTGSAQAGDPAADPTGDPTAPASEPEKE